MGAVLPMGVLRETDYYEESSPDRLRHAEANWRRCYGLIAGEPPDAYGIAERVEDDLLTTIDCGDGETRNPALPQDRSGELSVLTTGYTSPAESRQGAGPDTLRTAAAEDIRPESVSVAAPFLTYLIPGDCAAFSPAAQPRDRHGAEAAPSRASWARGWSRWKYIRAGASSRWRQRPLDASGVTSRSRGSRAGRKSLER